MKKNLFLSALLVSALAIVAVSCNKENPDDPILEEPDDVKEYVDLGLPSGTLWASCNIGATKPEEYGFYFAWGDTKARTADFDWTHYQYANGSSSTLTKYCNNSSYGEDGFTDGKTTLDSEDDAATVNWGSDWRLPTLTEINELKTECTWDWTIENGVQGYKVSGKGEKSDNSIFLPAAGYRDGSDLIDDGNYGIYWSSALPESYPHYAYCLLFYNDGYNWDYYYRYCGFTVRPVRASSK